MKELINRAIKAGLMSVLPGRRGRPPSKDDLFTSVHGSVDDVGVSEACRRHNVSRQGYYKWVKRTRPQP